MEGKKSEEGTVMWLLESSPAAVIPSDPDDFVNGSITANSKRASRLWVPAWSCQRSIEPFIIHDNGAKHFHSQSHHWH
jgi:hypothetical protein